MSSNLGFSAPPTASAPPRPQAEETTGLYDLGGLRPPDESATPSSPEQAVPPEAVRTVPEPPSDISRASDEFLDGTGFDLEILIREHEQAHDWKGLVPLLENAARGARADEDRIKWLNRVSEIKSSHLNDHAGAAETCRAILEIDPDQDLVRRKLESALRRAKDWEAVLELTREKLAAAKSDAERADLHRALGDLLERRLERPNDAADEYWKVLEYQADDDQSLDALERIYESEGQYRQMIALLQSRLEIAEEQADQIAIRFQIGQIYLDELEKPERAAEWLEGVLEIYASHLPTMNLLEQIYRELDQKADLLRVYQSQAAAVDMPMVKLGALGSLIQLAGELDNEEAELDGHVGLLGIDSNNRKSLERVAELAPKYGKARAAAEAESKLAELSDAVPDKVAHLVRASGEFELSGDLDAAKQSAERALELDGSALQALEILANAQINREEWIGAVQTIDRLIPQLNSDAHRAAWFGMLSRILREQLNNPMQAREAARAALQLDPNAQEAILQLAYLSVETGDTHEGGRLLEQLAASSDLSDDQRFEVLTMLGYTLESVGQAAAALSRYEEATQLRPDDIELQIAVGRLHYPAGRHHKALDLLLSVLERRDELSETQNAAVLFHLGKVFYQLGDTEQAVAHMKDVLELDPNHVEAAAALKELEEPGETSILDIEELGVELEEVESAPHFLFSNSAGPQDGRQDEPTPVPDAGVAVRETMVSGSIESVDADDETRMLDLDADPLAGKKADQILTEAVTMIAQGKSDEAAESLDRLLMVKPDHRKAILMLLDIRTEQREWSEAAALLVQLARLTKRPNRRAEIYVTAANTYREELGDLENTIRCCNDALNADPFHGRAAELLAEVLTQESEWQLLESNYRRMLRRLEGHSGPAAAERGRAIWKKIGELLRDHTDRDADAEEAFARAEVL